MQLDMRRIVTTSFGISPQVMKEYSSIADEVLILAAVTPLGPSERNRKNAIKEAMVRVVEAAKPGDICCQDDVEFTRDPWGSPLKEGQVTLLTDRQSEDHACPQAFRFADTATQARIIDEWRADRRRSCYGWTRIPMIEYLAGRHMT